MTNTTAPANLTPDQQEARTAVLVLAYGIRAALFGMVVVYLVCTPQAGYREPLELLGWLGMAMAGSVGVDYLVRTVCRLAVTE